MVQFCYLLHFSQRCKLLSWKAAFTIEFFAAVNSNYNHKQWAYDPQKRTKWIEINQSQTMTFWTGQVLFPKRSAKMIDGSEKCKCQLAFELKNSHVFEKRRDTLLKHWDCFLSPVAINDKDGHGLKLEKLGPTFSIFNPVTAEMSPKNIMVCAPCGRNWLDTCIFYLTVRVKHFV